MKAAEMSLVCALWIAGSVAGAESKIVKDGIASGSALYAAIERHLLENVNDASRLEIVSLGDAACRTEPSYKWTGGIGREDEKRAGVIGRGYWRPIRKSGIAISAKYRATNRFGALVLEVGVFCVGHDGKVFAVVAPADFSAGQPVQHRDPFNDQFEALLRSVR